MPPHPAASRVARASFVAQGGTQGLRPPRLSRTGARRRQHVPPCTNATHAHPATSRHHAPASRAPLPRRTCARHTPAFTRQRATHACHTAHAHAYPRPSRASKPRTPCTNATHAHCHTPAITRQQAAHAATPRMRTHTSAIHAPASTRTPATPRTRTHTPAIHAPASRACHLTRPLPGRRGRRDGGAGAGAGSSS